MPVDTGNTCTVRNSLMFYFTATTGCNDPTAVTAAINSIAGNSGVCDNALYNSIVAAASPPILDLIQMPSLLLN